MDGYGPSTYGDRFADVYDDWYEGVSDVDATVARIAGLAGDSPVLELGAGSGRLAVPMAAAGLDVWAIDASDAMLGRLRARPDGERVHAVLDDMAVLGDPALQRPGGFAVALCAFNTLFNLTDTAAQRRCLTRARALLAQGGVLLVEAFVPPPDEGAAAAGAVEPRHIGLDEVVLTVSRLDTASRTVVGQHVHITEAGVRLRPWMLHYASPAELDSLAAEADLRLVERHAGWRQEPFTDRSDLHVSVYAPGT